MIKEIKVKSETKKETYYKCVKYGDEIYWNTHKKMTFCKCGSLGVDGCEYCVRLIGNEADREKVMRYRKL